jgi:trimeric autotransporter adhesin
MSGTKWGAGDSSATELNGPNRIDTLVRWGANGLAFRAANGIFSLRSNAVDLSSSNADLAVTTSSPAAVSTGTSFNVTSVVANNGPSTSTDVVLTDAAPVNTAIVSITASQGTCSAASTSVCNLGSIANGATATVTLVLKAMNSGLLTATASVASDQNDPVTSNNSAAAVTTATGSTYAVAPVISTIAPNAALAGTQDTVLTITGLNFASDSAVYAGSTQLNTTFVSPLQLNAILSASQMATLGWEPISVQSVTQGGGSSNAVPFTVYQVVNLSANHMIFEPFSRMLYATVNSSATQVQSNSLVAIDPATASLGTPISVGSQPSSMAETGDGEYLYINQIGSNSVACFNLGTQKVEFSFPISLSSNLGGPAIALRDIAVMPGTDTTVAIDTGDFSGNGIWDVDLINGIGAQRGTTTTGSYTGSSLQFLNASELFTFDIDTTGQTLDAYSISASGFSYPYATQYTLNDFSAFKIRGHMAYANAGGVADLSGAIPAPAGVFLNPGANEQNIYETASQITEPDPSLGLSFFAVLGADNSGQLTGSLQTFNQSTYTLTSSLALPTLNAGQTSSASLPLDFVRFGQDGLALLTNTGQIVLLRGGFVVPELLQQNSPASLTAASNTSLTHGSGNTVLTLTGSNFLPGVAALWNGVPNDDHRRRDAHHSGNPGK